MKKILLIFSILTLIISCAKQVKKGKRIVANGYVVDTLKNKRLPFAKVYLVGCHREFSGRKYCTDYVDSATTDANGNFSITYRAEGNSAGYVLEVKFDNNYGDYSLREFPFVNEEVTRITAHELNFLRLNLKVGFNRYDTLYIDPRYGDSKQLIGRSIDTTILLKVLPNIENLIAYQIAAKGFDSGFISRRMIDTVRVGFADTTVTSKTINSTYQLPFY